MMERVLFRWKNLFGCTVVLTVLIVFLLSTGKITVSKLTMQKSKKSNSTNQSAISETKSLSTKHVFKTKPVSETKPICLAFDKLSSNVTNTTRKGCSMSVFTSRNPKDYYSQNSSCPLCTSALFKDYYRTHSAFISDGYWDVLASGNEWSATFRPPFCSFTHRDLDSNFIMDCFSRRRVRKIVTFGDSNGRRTFFGLKAILATTGIKQCELVKEEEDNYFTNISYYLPAGTNIPSGYVSIGKRGCHSCNGRQFRCFYEKKDLSGLSRNTSIVLEHLPLSRIFDSSVRIVNSIAGFKPTNYTQEFLFRDYLGQTGQPDVVIIVTPFIHEVFAGLEKHGKLGLKVMIRNLVAILKKYLPTSTQVYWVPSQFIFGGSALAAVRRCNQDLYEALKAEVGAEGDSMHGTFDLLSMSCPLVELSLGNDPYHMHPKWYEVIGKHLLELHCH